VEGFIGGGTSGQWRVDGMVAQLRPVSHSSERPLARTHSPLDWTR